MILYRPVGRAELHLIIESDFCAFPPRLPHQPIFYPVLEREYAQQIARDWNTQDEASGFAGWVTSFDVADDFLKRYLVHVVGRRQHQELWVPAEELTEFNSHIAGQINIVDAYASTKFQSIDTATFIGTYENSELDRIAFLWNGQHADDLRDWNVEFRQELIRRLMPNMSLASPQLLRDLFVAETKFAKVAWGINLWVANIAQEMLVRGGAPFVEDFLRGKLLSMDTSMTCAMIKIPGPLAQTFTSYCNERKSLATTDSDSALWAHGEEFFSALAA